MIKKIQNIVITLVMLIILGLGISYPVLAGDHDPPTPTLSAPQFNYSSGTYSTALNVTISGSGSGIIYYTTNGNTPSTYSPRYTGPISITKTTTIKTYAHALNGGYYDSPVNTVTYNLNVAPPIITSSTNNSNLTQIVTINCSTTGAVIHYTTNGSIPNSSSPVYQSPFTISSTTTINAYATTGTVDSMISSVIYNITSSSSSTGQGTAAVSKMITYYDTDNVVTLKFGNDNDGYQYGKIFYDSLIGKPIKIQREITETWQTIKEYGYDSAGRLSWEKDSLGNTTNYTYDALDRKIQIKQPNGSITSMAWNDRSLTITDANGHQKTQNYDLLDRLIKVLEHPDQSTTYTTSYTYDTVSNLVELTNPRRSTPNYLYDVNYIYDNLGRLVQTNFPQDGTNPMQPEKYTYDAVGNLKTKEIAGKTTTNTYQFYAGYRLKTVTESDGRSVVYEYDNNDNITSQVASGAGRSSVDYRFDPYDARNRVTGMTASIDGRSFHVQYNYDVFNRVTSITYPNRSNPITYHYDELDRLVDMPGFVSSTGYYANNQLKQMVYANGVVNSYTYDANGRPTNISAGQGNLLNLTYTYDAVGNITKINNDNYSYNGINRLTWYGNKPLEQATTANGTRWTYDGAGNIANKEKLLNGVSQGVTSFGYDLANRLWSMGAATYNNDSRGSRTQKTNGDAWNYIYDGEARLTQVNKNGVTQVQNVYDGFGLRVKKVENGKTTYYINSGVNPLMEYSANDGSYLYRIYAGNQAIAEETNGVVKFLHKDQLGSTRVVTNASGSKIAEYKFAPYGEKEISTGNGTEYGFTDKADDDSTGLDYFGFRFYDPEVGRFITQDPIKDSMNWYEYCNDNPVNFIDPLGLTITCPDKGLRNRIEHDYGRDIDHDGKFGNVSYRDIEKFLNKNLFNHINNFYNEQIDIERGNDWFQGGDKLLSKMFEDEKSESRDLLKNLTKTDAKPNYETIVYGVGKVVFGYVTLKGSIAAIVVTDGVASVVGVPGIIYGKCQIIIGISEITLGIKGKAFPSNGWGDFFSLSPGDIGL